MKKLLTVIVFTLFLFLLTACGEKTTPSEFIKQENEQVLYVNNEKGFSFIMPATWEYMENAELDQISFLSRKENANDPFQENFYAGCGTSTSPTKKNITAEEVYQMLIEKAENGGGDTEGFSLLGYEYVTLANEKALKLSFRGTSENAPDLDITFTQWYLSKGATNYMCQYTAQTENYDKYLPVIDEAVASFSYIMAE
ncbi:MAG: PsbP-related protein [Clostridia bacterium]|nr:PsbP-related protein [Clostridia bacterium]